LNESIWHNGEDTEGSKKWKLREHSSPSYPFSLGVLAEFRVG